MTQNLQPLNNVTDYFTLFNTLNITNVKENMALTDFIDLEIYKLTSEFVDLNSIYLHNKDYLKSYNTVMGNNQTDISQKFINDLTSLSYIKNDYDLLTKFFPGNDNADTLINLEL
jgi:hypothetical protein